MPATATSSQRLDDKKNAEHTPARKGRGRNFHGGAGIRRRISGEHVLTGEKTVHETGNAAGGHRPAAGIKKVFDPDNILNPGKSGRRNKFSFQNSLQRRTKSLRKEEVGSLSVEVIFS